MLTLILLGYKDSPSHICKIVIRFIILVREAIYLLLKFDLPVINFCSLISYNTQLCAVIEGMVILIFLLQWGDCLPFSIDPLDYFDRFQSLEKSLRSLADIGLLIRQFLRVGTSLISSLSTSFFSSPNNSFLLSLTLSIELYLWGSAILADTNSISGLLLALLIDFLVGSGGIFLII